MTSEIEQFMMPAKGLKIQQNLSPLNLSNSDLNDNATSYRDAMSRSVLDRSQKASRAQHQKVGFRDVYQSHEYSSTKNIDS